MATDGPSECVGSSATYFFCRKPFTLLVLPTCDAILGVRFGIRPVLSRERFSMAVDAATIGRELLVHRHRITAMAALVIHEPQLADDVFQQVAVQALENPDRFSDAVHLLRWALRAARHRAVDLAKSRQRLVLDDSVYELLEADASEVPATNLAARLAALRGCVDALPKSTRKLIQLRYERGMSGGDIAERMGRTVEAVYQALYRVHQQLKRCVDLRTASD